MRKWRLYGFTTATALGWLVFGWFSGDADGAWSRSAADASSGPVEVALFMYVLFMLSLLTKEFTLKLRRDAPAAYGFLTRGFVTAGLALALACTSFTFCGPSVVIWLVPAGFLGVLLACTVLCIMYPGLTQAGVDPRIVRGALVATAAWGVAALFLFVVFLVRVQSPGFLQPGWHWARAARGVTTGMTALSILGFLVAAVGSLVWRIVLSRKTRSSKSCA